MSQHLLPLQIPRAFPFISPAGRFTDQFGTRRQVLDGGYFENYGVRTAAELALGIAKVGAELGLDLVPVVVVVSNDADALRQPNGKPLADQSWMPTIEETTVTCRLAAVPSAEIARERARAAEGYAVELVAPLLGLYATRAAHGQDALHILRRQVCPPPGQDTPARLFHLVVPRPDRGDEAAPMNWVLNSAARNFLLEVVPTVPFNVQQARELRGFFADLRGSD